MRPQSVRSALVLTAALSALAGCDYNEPIVIENMTGTVVIPREAATQTIVAADGTSQTITDARFIGPVYLGLYPSIVSGVELYPHPELGPQYKDGKPGDTYPYGGTTIGDFRYACMEFLTCKAVSGRYATYDDLVDWYKLLNQPVVDAQGLPVEGGEILRQTCFDLMRVFSDDEIRLVTGDTNGDGEANAGDLDFVEREDGNFEGEFTLWQQEYFAGFSLWGYMDAPSEVDSSFSTCNPNLGYQEVRYDSSFFGGRVQLDVLNVPSSYVGKGDFVAGTQMSPSGETLGYVYEDVTDRPELWLNVGVE